jgi:adenosyl cobinamide kinase/adenosyl cobinamide phosphate guanylyltransferase
MHLIFGGAYQGKLDYVKERYGVTEQDVWDCSLVSGGHGEQTGSTLINHIDYSKKVIDHLEAFILACVKSGEEAKELLADSKALWKDSVIICADISSGIVPCDAELRAWREMTGRTLMYLGSEAQEVTRIFCGIPQKVK